jgi:phosphoglycerate dehydrogenase-like enzyme
VYTNPILPDILATLGDAELVQMTPDNPREEVLAAIARATAVLNPGDLNIDADLLDGSPHLKIIANAARGFDNLNPAELAQPWHLGDERAGCLHRLDGGGDDGAVVDGDATPGGR